MASNDAPRTNDVRLSKKGLETPSQKGKVQGGFGDTKKVLILGALGLVALAVVAYQFLGGSGPAPAEASPTKPEAPSVAPAAAAAVPDAGPADVSAALDRIGKGGEDGLSVERVENMVSKFDTYVQERQIPLASLEVNPFQVVRGGGIEAQEDKKARQQANAEAEAEARRQRILQAAAELKLSTVLIAGSTRTAVIEGRLYHVGDVVEGMRVAKIERDNVTLAYEDQTVDLRLRPEWHVP
ncbi:MAG: hypothetical protein R6X20_16630 [Phycisphaerae bacterium]